MARYWTFISVAFVLLLTSCGFPEGLPKPDIVLPKGYSEKVVPQEFIDEMGFGSRAGEMWMRCIDCKEDWEGLNQHVLNVLGPQGYKETSSEWFSAMNKTENWSPEVREVMKKIMRTYSSEMGYAHIMLMDLKELKQMGAQITTSGDFLVLAAVDDIDQYK